MTPTPQQAAIIAHRDGAALVIAGPGSGKTFTLCARCAALMRDGVDPATIWLTTFTRRAAQEMAARVAAYGHTGGHALRIGTFHTLAARSLRQAGERFTVAGQGDTHDLWQRLRTAHHLTRTDPSAKQLAAWVSRAANSECALADVLPDARHEALVEDLAAAYAAAKQTYHLFDYDDILLTFRARLRDDPTLRARIGVAYLMVDEYQDTNLVQADIITRLMADAPNVMVVGDEWQGIYAFRGATIQNILHFQQAFPQAVRYDLTVNFRASATLVTTAQQVMRDATETLNKTLLPHRAAGVAPVVMPCEDARAEAVYITRAVQALLTQGVSAADIAVLYRNTYHAATLDMFCTSQGIPFAKYGGQKLVEAAHVRDLLAATWVLVDPQHTLAWQRLARLLPGVGQVTAAKIAASLRGASDVAALLPYAPVPRAAVSAWDTLTGWYRGYTPGTAADAVLWAWAWYEPYFAELYPDSPFRADGLRALVATAETAATPADFLNEFSLAGDVDEPADPTARLTLSTIHSAKAREWAHVFILHAYDGAIPSARGETLEEERRLFYVAVTRAKDSVTVTWPSRVARGEQQERTQASRFLQSF